MGDVQDEPTVEPIVDDPTNEPPMNELDQQIAQLQSELEDLNKKDTIHKLQEEIKDRTEPDVHHWYWPIQRFLRRLNNWDTWSAVDWGTLVIFILGSIMILSQLASGHVDETTAICMNIGLGILSQFGSLLTNKYGLSNSLPSTPYAYSIDAITSYDTTDTSTDTSTATITTNYVVTDDDTLAIDEQGVC